MGSPEASEVVTFIASWSARSRACERCGPDAFGLAFCSLGRRLCSCRILAAFAQRT